MHDLIQMWCQDLGRRRLPADRFASLTGVLDVHAPNLSYSLNNKHCVAPGLTLGAQLPQAQAPDPNSILL